MPDHAPLAVDPATRKAFDDMYAVTAENQDVLEEKSDYTCETYTQQPKKNCGVSV